MDLTRIYAPIQHNLETLDSLLRAELGSADPFIGELVEYVLATRGKLVRPALACLAAEAVGGGDEERLYVAATVELIHIASLIHDDIIDEANVRRGAATINLQWGNQIAVLLGDYLFARAFDLISRVRHPDVAPAVAHAAVRMSQAEIKQIKYASEPYTEEAVYFDIIEGKTADLFAATCRAGALVAGGTRSQADALAAFGLNWGMSFQITDDALDLTSRPEELGKPIGSDIRGGQGHASGHPRAEARRRSRSSRAHPAGGVALAGWTDGRGARPARAIRRDGVRAGGGPDVCREGCLGTRPSAPVTSPGEPAGPDRFRPGARAMSTPDPRPESTLTVAQRLAANVAAMLQTYGALTAAEARATGADFLTGAVLMLAAAVLGVLLLAMVVLTAILLLALVLPPWEAALIVLVAAALVTAVLVLIALGRFRRRRLSKVMAAFKEDLRWLQMQLRGHG